jgi:hypothetical protein
MKITANLSLLIILSATLFWSCDDNSSKNNGLKPLLNFIGHSPCKYEKSTSVSDITPDSLSCVNYSYNVSTGKLSITHINAGFNCCPDEIYCTFIVEADTLIITERETSALCDCNCLFDLELEISDVQSASYIIKFDEPYCYDQEKLLFPVNLADQPTGSVCVVRKQYPWDLGIF